MSKRMTPIERFIAEIPADRRRAYDARQAKQGLVRVTVTVPLTHVESLKTFARLLRNSSMEELAQFRREFEDYLGDSYAAMDADIASGRWDPNA